MTPGHRHAVRSVGRPWVGGASNSQRAQVSPPASRGLRLTHLPAADPPPSQAPGGNPARCPGAPAPGHRHVWGPESSPQAVPVWICLHLGSRQGLLRQRVPLVQAVRSLEAAKNWARRRSPAETRRSWEASSRIEAPTWLVARSSESRSACCATRTCPTPELGDQRGAWGCPRELLDAEHAHASREPR